MLLSALHLDVPATHIQQPRRFSRWRHTGSPLPNSCSRGMKREDNTTPLPNCAHTSTAFAHSKLEQTGHNCKPTPVVQPDKQLEEDSTWPRPQRPNTCLKTGSLLLLTFCEWLPREIHSSPVYTQALFWQIKKTRKIYFFTVWNTPVIK